MPCRWTATPRPASRPTRGPGAAGTASQANNKGPITRTFLEVLEALLWGFHNARTGCCFPSYEAIADQRGVRPQHRRRGAEGAGGGRRADLAAPHRPDPRARARPVRPVGEPLAGHPHLQRLRLQRPESGGFRRFRRPSPKILREQRTKMLLCPLAVPPAAPDSPLERALARFGAAIEGRLLANGSGGTV